MTHKRKAQSNVNVAHLLSTVDIDSIYFTPWNNSGHRFLTYSDDSPFRLVIYAYRSAVSGKYLAKLHPNSKLKTLCDNIAQKSQANWDEHDKQLPTFFQVPLKTTQFDTTCSHDELVLINGIVYTFDEKQLVRFDEKQLVRLALSFTQSIQYFYNLTNIGISVTINAIEKADRDLDRESECCLVSNRLETVLFFFPLVLVHLLSDFIVESTMTIIF